ncbi:MAG: ABC transporter substrate-binding protein [Marmoricola sp.]
MHPRPTISATVAALLTCLSACGSTTGYSFEQTAADAVQLVDPGDLTVCSDVPYPPFEDFDEAAPSGFGGFDIDVIGYVARRLELNLVIKDSDFDALQSGLLLATKKCDLGASAMTITDERKKHLLFSDGYYKSKQSLLVPAGSSIKSIADLAGKKVGVQRGTTGESYTKEHAPDAKRIQFKDDGTMYLALKAGTIDAILQDLPVNLDHQNDPKEPGKFTVVETYDTAEEYGFAAAKDNTKLIDAVNKALADMKAAGTYQSIYDTYFAVK